MATATDKVIRDVSQKIPSFYLTLVSGIHGSIRQVDALNREKEISVITMANLKRDLVAQSQEIKRLKALVSVD